MVGAIKVITSVSSVYSCDVLHGDARTQLLSRRLGR